MAVNPAQKELGTQLNAYDAHWNAQRALGTLLRSSPWIASLYLAAACVGGPVAPPAIAQTPSLSPPGQPTLEIPTPADTPTIFATPTETPKPQWFLHDAAAIREFLLDESKLLAPGVAAGQRQDLEYPDASKFSVQDFEKIKINACGPAVFTTLLRAFGLAKNGVVPDDTVGSTVTKLMEGSYTFEGKTYSFFDPGFTVDQVAFREALRQMGEGIFGVVEITPAGQPDDLYIEPIILDEALVSTMEEKVFSRGGVVTLLALMPYGVGGKNVPHILIATNLYWDSNLNTAKGTFYDPWNRSVTKDITIDEFFPDGSPQQPYVVAAFTGVVPKIN